MTNNAKLHHLSIVNFKGWFDLDLIFQGHNRYGKWCPVVSSLIVIDHKSVSLMVTEIWPIENFEGWFDHDLISQGHHKYGKWCSVTSSLIVISHKSVFYLDLISQGHHKYSIWCPVTSSFIVINHNSVSLTIDNFECRSDLDLITQGHFSYTQWQVFIFSGSWDMAYWNI